MYIVILENNEKHSAWDSKEEAENQVKVLKNYGYKNPYIKFCGAYYKMFSNGHYFI